jgi:pimeloyl-ACP methyl ester carboxylesterase
MSHQLRIQEGGAGSSVLLLLHGLGATGDVWAGVQRSLEGRWAGRWVTPDLPGHGGSDPLARYSFGHLAAALVEIIPPTDRLIVVGHSLGGVLGLALASGWFGVQVAAVAGVGIKVEWTDDELARARALSAKAHPIYSTRAEAAERHLKVAGLAGLVPAGDVPDAALKETPSGWTLALDPRAFGVGAPDVRGLLAAARAPVVLAAGERDSMSRPEQLARLVPEPIIFPDAGHNVQVERPELIVGLVDRLSRL